MRYRITNGVIEFFKSLFENTVYVPDVSEAFDLLDKYSNGEANPAPAVIAITRRDCEPIISTPKMNYVRGTFSNATKNNSFLGTAVMNVKITYDLSVLSYDQYTTDTLVDELYMVLLEKGGAGCEYTYNSGVRDVNDESKEMVVKSHIILEQGPFGEMSESVNVGESGRVYRTTFSISTIGAVYNTFENKVALKVPVVLGD